MKHHVRAKIRLLLLCLIASIAIIYGLSYLYNLNAYKNITSSISIVNIDVSKLKDGIYNGEFDAKLIAAKTRVTVKAGKITNIELLRHKNERGKPAEAILSKVMAAQSLEVDTVSGATNSSKVILKSIENALKTATKK